MLYLLHGKDTLKSRAKIQATISAFAKKNPHSNVFRVSRTDFNESQFLEFLGAQSLFSDKLLIVCDNLLNNKDKKDPLTEVPKNNEIGDFILEHLKEIKNSPNVFIIIEDNLKKADFQEIKNKSEKVFEFDLDKKEEADRFNAFSISDAFGERNKRKLWIAFSKAKREGYVAEEIFWKIVWQVKNILLSFVAEREGEKSLTKLKISPFVVGKAKKYARNFKESELKDIYGELVSLYHESRRQSMDFDLALESYILNLK